MRSGLPPEPTPCCPQGSASWPAAPSSCLASRSWSRAACSSAPRASPTPGPTPAWPPTLGGWTKPLRTWSCGVSMQRDTRLCASVRQALQPRRAHAHTAGPSTCPRLSSRDASYKRDSHSLIPRRGTRKPGSVDDAAGSRAAPSSAEQRERGGAGQLSACALGRNQPTFSVTGQSVNISGLWARRSQLLN